MLTFPPACYDQAKAPWFQESQDLNFRVPDICIHNLNSIWNTLDVILINMYLSKRVTESLSWEWLTTLILPLVWVHETQARLPFSALNWQSSFIKQTCQSYSMPVTVVDMEVRQVYSVHRTYILTGKAGDKHIGQVSEDCQCCGENTAK